MALKRILEVAGSVDKTTMTLQYLETLKQIGSSPSTKFVIPVELTSMLSGLVSPNGARATNGASAGSALWAHDGCSIGALVFPGGGAAPNGASPPHLWQDGYRHMPTIGPLLLAAALSPLGPRREPSALAAGLGGAEPSLGISGFGLVLLILASSILSVNVDFFVIKDAPLICPLCHRLDRAGRRPRLSS